MFLIKQNTFFNVKDCWLQVYMPEILLQDLQIQRISNAQITRSLECCCHCGSFIQYRSCSAPEAGGAVGAAWGRCRCRPASARLHFATARAQDGGGRPQPALSMARLGRAERGHARGKGSDGPVPAAAVTDTDGAGGAPWGTGAGTGAPRDTRGCGAQWGAGAVPGLSEGPGLCQGSVRGRSERAFREGAGAPCGTGVEPELREVPGLREGARLSEAPWGAGVPAAPWPGPAEPGLREGAGRCSLTGGQRWPRGGWEAVAVSDEGKASCFRDRQPQIGSNLSLSVASRSWRLWWGDQSKECKLSLLPFGVQRFGRFCCVLFLNGCVSSVWVLINWACRMFGNSVHLSVQLQHGRTLCLSTEALCAGQKDYHCHLRPAAGLCHWGSSLCGRWAFFPLKY